MDSKPAIYYVLKEHTNQPLTLCFKGMPFDNIEAKITPEDLSGILDYSPQHQIIPFRVKGWTFQYDSRNIDTITVNNGQLEARIIYRQK